MDTPSWEPDVPGTVWQMGRIPWQFEFLSILVPQIRLLFSKLLFNKLFTGSSALPPPPPPTLWMVWSLAILYVLTNRMWVQMILPISNWGLASYKMFPLAHLGVLNSAMRRTDPEKPLIQEGETWGINMRITCSLKQSHPSPLADPGARKKKCFIVIC